MSKNNNGPRVNNHLAIEGWYNRLKGKVMR